MKIGYYLCSFLWIIIDIIMDAMEAFDYRLTPRS